MTVFKTCAEDDTPEEPEEEVEREGSRRLEVADGAAHHCVNETTSRHAGVEKGNTTVDDGDEEEEDEGLGDIPPPLQLLHPQNKEMALGKSVIRWQVSYALDMPV